MALLAGGGTFMRCGLLGGLPLREILHPSPFLSLFLSLFHFLVTMRQTASIAMCSHHDVLPSQKPNRNGTTYYGLKPPNCEPNKPSYELITSDILPQR
jgi:hypothetical protein